MERLWDLTQSPAGSTRAHRKYIVTFDQKMYGVKTPGYPHEVPVCESCMEGHHLSFGTSHVLPILLEAGRAGCKNEGVFKGCHVQCACNPGWEELWDIVEKHGPEIKMKQDKLQKRSPQMNKLSSMLDSIAERLESKGLLKEAEEIDVISNTIKASMVTFFHMAGMGSLTP